MVNSSWRKSSVWSMQVVTREAMEAQPVGMSSSVALVGSSVTSLKSESVAVPVASSSSDVVRVSSSELLPLALTLPEHSAWAEQRGQMSP